MERTFDEQIFEYIARSRSYIRRPTVVITEVRIKLVSENSERLMAYCSMVLDNKFVVREMKIIEGAKGLLVSMASRKLMDRCGRCGCKNHLRARYCNGCGAHLDENRAPRDRDGRAKLHADIAHPINSACREVMQIAIIKAYQDERERAKLPGYVCTYDDYDDGDFDYRPHVNSGAIVRADVGHQPRRSLPAGQNRWVRFK